MGRASASGARPFHSVTLNNWCPPLIGVLRANHDIKLITNGGETKSAAWYITGYATKGQKRTYNSSALLARAMYYHERSDAYRHDLLERNRLLLYRCWNALNRQMELSLHAAVLVVRAVVPTEIVPGAVARSRVPEDELEVQRQAQTEPEDGVSRVKRVRAQQRLREHSG